MSGFCPATELLVAFGVAGKAISNPRSGERKAGHCGASCTANYPTGQIVELAATPQTGYTFTGWSGACSGTGPCIVTMSAGRQVSATFTSIPVALAVPSTRARTGTVLSQPAGIDCGVVSIRGKVTGQVHGRKRIELLSGCRVQETLVSPKLVIEDGAFFQGDCRMGGPPEGPVRAGEKEPA